MSRTRRNVPGFITPCNCQEISLIVTGYNYDKIVTDYNRGLIDGCYIVQNVNDGWKNVEGWRLKRHTKRFLKHKMRRAARRKLKREL